MSRFGFIVSISLCIAACSSTLATHDSASTIAQLRAANAAEAWARVDAVRSRGTLAVGGLEGEFESLENARDGRSTSRYEIGPIQGGQGFDGTGGWSQTGGEVVAPDGEEALARARTGAWLARRGYLDADDAVFGPWREESSDGKTFTVVDATPSNGSPVALWFDANSRQLARSIQQMGQDRMVTRYEDYRDVQGIPMAFRIVSEGNDPRNRTIVTYASIEIVPDPGDGAFARPEALPTDFVFVDGAYGATMPFELINNHIYLEANIDGQPVRLLFDTGGINLLTPQAVAKLGLSSEGKMAARGVGEQQVDVGFARAKSLRLGTLQLDDPLFYVMDLGDLPAVEGIEFDGLVGYEIFHRLAVSIDYASRMLTMTQFDHYTAPSGATMVPFVLGGRIPVVDGDIDGRAAKLSIDTGSRASLSFHSPFVREHGLVDHYGARFETVTGWGVGGPLSSWPVRVGQVRLGSAGVRDVVADLATVETGAFANPDISANVGSGLLRRFVVDFDYRARRMYLVPGRDHDAPDHYDRAGLWLMRDGDVLRVGAVTVDGPAAAAGLRDDDRITAIDGVPASSKSLAEWRAWLRETPAGTRLTVDYRRGGTPAKTTMALADLIAPPAG